MGTFAPVAVGVIFEIVNFLDALVGENFHAVITRKKRDIERDVFKTIDFAELFQEVNFGMFDGVVEELGAILNVVFGDGEVDLVSAEDPLIIPETGGGGRTEVVGRLAELFEELWDRLRHVASVVDAVFHAVGSLSNFLLDAFNFAEAAIDGDLADFVRGGSFSLARQDSDTTAVFFELGNLVVVVVFFDGDEDVGANGLDEVPFRFVDSFDDDGVSDIEEANEVVAFALRDDRAGRTFALTDFFVAVHTDDEEVAEGASL